jgi:hypothetical protein
MLLGQKRKRVLLPCVILSVSVHRTLCISELRSFPHSQTTSPGQHSLDQHLSLSGSSKRKDHVGTFDFYTQSQIRALKIASFNCTWTECQKERPFLASVCYAAPGPLLVRPSLLSTVATVNCFLSLLFFLLSLPLTVLVSTLQLSFSQVSALYIFWDFIFWWWEGAV